MKTIGLIGGTSWHSTAEYYRVINQGVSERLGGLHSAKLVMHSIDMTELITLSSNNDWNGVALMFGKIAKNLESAGADCVAICANMPHIVADDIGKFTSVPLLHIADATAREVASRSIHKIGLLGTKFTMEAGFYPQKLEQYQVSVITPELTERQWIQESILNELGQGIFIEPTKVRYLGIIDNLVAQGAEGIILGCTEIPLIIKQEDCRVPVFDTAIIHARAAVDFALSDTQHQ